MKRATREADHRLSLVISNLVLRTCSLLREVSQTTAKLTLLDHIAAHDAVLTDEQLRAAGRIPDWDEVRAALGGACNELRHELDYAEKAHQRMQGLLRGELKHRYEEMLARGVRSVQHRLEQMEQFTREYKPPVTPFAIRQVALSALTELCMDVARRARQLRKDERTDDVSADFKAELRSCEAELFALKSTLGKLRDNPTQKMEPALTACSQRAEAIWKRLGELMEAAKTRCGRVV